MYLHANKKADSYLVQDAEPQVVRKTLNRIRNLLGSPFFGSPAKRMTPRATPEIPETRAQRARREREAREAIPPVLKRQADKFAVKKSTPREGRPRHSTYNIPTFNKLDFPGSLDHHRQSLQVRRVEIPEAGVDAHSTSDDDTITDPDLLSSDQGQANVLPDFGGSNRKTSRAKREIQTSHTSLSANSSNQENRTPPTRSSANNLNLESPTTSINSPGQDSNQENERPRTESDQENQAPIGSKRPIQRHVEDWNSAKSGRKQHMQSQANRGLISSLRYTI